MTVPLSDTRLAVPAYGVVFDRPDHDRVYAWGPFASLDMAARFAMFVRSEIDPAKVVPWSEATGLPGVRVVDPVAELLTWSTTVAQRQADACPADCPCRSTPLPARWDKTVVHPTPGDTECPDTLVCCVAATGQPVALWLDDEHREALGLALLLPDGDGEVDPQHLELQRENERLAAEVSTLRAQVTAVEEHARRKSHRGVVVDPNILLMIIADHAAPTS